MSDTPKPPVMFGDIPKDYLRTAAGSTQCSECDGTGSVRADSIPTPILYDCSYPSSADTEDLKEWGCSVCGEYFYFTETKKPNFCPQCGAHEESA